MENNPVRMDDRAMQRSALKFVVLLGFVSLLADITYEGARGITGPFREFLGASAAVVGVVAGAGELIGYGLRLATGFWADKTGSYWTFTIIGYAVNLLAVPLMALAGRWEIAAALIVAERLGKAIRTPARDAILSSATHHLGHGKGFGLHEFMDQLGAVSGPLIMSAVLFFKGSYTWAFGVLAIPAAMALAVLTAGRIIYPQPRDFEPKSLRLGRTASRSFWIYMVGIGFLAMGYADFALMAFHVKKISLFTDDQIPLIYAGVMGVDAISALVCGYLFDKAGIRVMAAVALISACFAPLVFWGGLYAAVAGFALWGLGMGAQESIMRAAIAPMVAAEKRASAYGIFNAGYGLMWFIGSAVMGFLYGGSMAALIAFSVTTQLAAAAAFWFARAF